MMTKLDIALSHISSGATISEACRLAGVSSGEFVLMLGVDRQFGRSYRAAVELWEMIAAERSRSTVTKR